MCMLHPLSFDIQKQEREIEAAQVGFSYQMINERYLPMLHTHTHTHSHLPLCTEMINVFF